MPTYQYACKDCGHDFETVQSFSEPSLTECPDCSGPLRKVFNSVGVVFKGSGFYRNDSREAAKKSAAHADTSSKPAAASDKSSASSDKPSTSSPSEGSAPAKTDKKKDAKPASTPAASSS